MIQALKLRQSGDPTIETRLFGPPQELHPFSVNGIVVVFLDSKLGSYLTHTNLGVLRDSYDGDVVKLIDSPDQILREEPEIYVRRTIWEIMEVNKHVFDAEQKRDIVRRVELNELKVILAERVLGVRAVKGLKRGKIVVSLLTDPRPERNLTLVEHSSDNLKNMSFSLLSFDRHPFPSKIEELIEMGGGYDEVKPRPPRQ